MTLPSTPYQRFAYPVLRSLDAEAAHHYALTALQTLQRNSLALAILRQLFTIRHPRLERMLFGVRFANPVGVAAGFDKNGVAVEALAALGFGHIEVGTVTPRPQRGNERPRLVRLVRDEALINRLGFPNEGMRAIIPRLPPRGTRTFVLGINIGPNKTSVTAGRAIDDYLAALDYCAPVADYLAINISSPNTPGLRSLQQAQSLDDLLTSIFRHTSNERISTPIAVKLGPDLTRDDLRELVRVLMAHPVAAVIATNTTSSRPASLRDPLATESGGLSGRP
ncbi:MAG: quinone-dependent dihydroorotate dehydrogenase, partial [Chloroflexi bacterium]|nr:quinone-dependent dihydroorotate dehydrogenase [Chloroflexota bacterium]